MKTLNKLFSRLKPEIPSLVVLAVIIFIASRALFHPGFFRTIDDVTTVRIEYLRRELVRGDWLHNFPVRLSGELSHRFGYALYLYYAPLVYYAGALLMILLNLSHIVATKWVYVFPLIAGPFLFYWAARLKVSRLAALGGSFLYALFPFRGYDTYWRGGVGEAWAMAFLPGIFAGVFLIEKNKRVGYFLTAIFIFLTLISHNLGALLILAFVGLYGLVFLRRNFRFWGSFLLGLGLAAFFWLPSLYYLPIAKLNYSPQNSGQIFDYLLPFKALFGINFPIHGEDKFFGGFTYLLLFCLISFFVGIRKRFKGGKDRFFWLASSLVLFLLLFKFTGPVWTLFLPIARMLQFSWRLWLVLAFTLPLVLSLFLAQVDKKKQVILVLLVGLVAVFGFLPAFRPKAYSDFYEYRAEDSGTCATSWGDEYLPVWVEECRDKPPLSDLEVTGGANLKILENKITDIKTMVSGPGGELIVWRYYFPGWRVEIDGQPAAVDYRFTRWGIFKTPLPAGDHTVRVYFAKTPVMWLADMISLGSLGILGYLGIRAVSRRAGQFPKPKKRRK